MNRMSIFLPSDGHRLTASSFVLKAHAFVEPDGRAIVFEDLELDLVSPADRPRGEAGCVPATGCVPANASPGYLPPGVASGGHRRPGDPWCLVA